MNIDSGLRRNDGYQTPQCAALMRGLLHILPHQQPHAIHSGGGGGRGRECQPEIHIHLKQYRQHNEQGERGYHQPHDTLGKFRHLLHIFGLHIDPYERQQRRQRQRGKERRKQRVAARQLGDRHHNQRSHQCLCQ